MMTVVMVSLAALAAIVTVRMIYVLFSAVRYALRQRRRKTMGRAGTLETIIESLRREVTKRKEQRHPRTFGAYFIGYLYGLTDEANRLDGIGWEPDQLLRIHREADRIFGLPSHADGSPDQRLRALLKGSYGLRGIQDGRADVRGFATNTADPTSARSYLKALRKGRQVFFPKAAAFFAHELR